MTTEMTGTPTPKAPRANFRRLDDDPYVDEVHITTIPRFKESELSGDEWRTGARVEFIRKGVVVGIESYHSVPIALAYIARLGTSRSIPPASLKMSEGDPDYLTESAKMRHTDEDFCAQPGCAESWTVEYRLTARGCGRCGRVESHDEHAYWTDHRRFCDRHKTRGDSNLDDMDSHYELVEVREAR